MSGLARTGKATGRILLAHGLAYPVATAWAFALVPISVVRVASRVGLTLDDETVAHRVLVEVGWVAGITFALAHVAGVVWAFDRDETRGRRIFVAVLVGLLAVAALIGGPSWIWLMTR